MNIVKKLAVSKDNLAQSLKQKSNRHLATVEPPAPMVLAASSLTLQFLSVIPTFGEDEGYIAFLHEYSDELWNATKDFELYCYGPNHKSLMSGPLGGETSAGYKQMLVWKCDWPRGEASKDNYEIDVGDASGNQIGHVSINYNSSLLARYNIAACLKPAFFNPGSDVNTVLMLPQWLEYSLLHGVEHFIFYTTSGTDERILTVYKQYEYAGLGTRFHLEVPPDKREHFQVPVVKNGLIQHWALNDCLYRLKNHARWMMPSVDADEYIRFPNSSLHSWDQILNHYERHWPEAAPAQRWDVELLNKDHAPMPHALSFQLYAFRHPGTNKEFQMSSYYREEDIQDKCPKYVVKPDLVNTIFPHWPTSWAEGTVNIAVPIAMTIANHYSISGNSSETTVMDRALEEEVPLVLRAVQERFKMTWDELVFKFFPAGLAVAPTALVEAVRVHVTDDLSPRLEMNLTNGLRAWIEQFNKMDRLQIIYPPGVSDLRA